MTSTSSAAAACVVCDTTIDAEQIGDLCEPHDERHARLAAAEHHRVVEGQRQERRGRRRRTLDAAGVPAEIAENALRPPHEQHLRHWEPCRRWAHEGGTLTLIGEPGRGKSTLAARGLFLAATLGRLIAWRSAAEWVAGMMSDDRALRSRSERLTQQASTRALVLDDLDAVRATDFGAEQLYRALQEWTAAGSPLLVTANLWPSQIAERFGDLGPRMVSRLTGGAVVQVGGVDLRSASTVVA